MSYSGARTTGAATTWAAAWWSRLGATPTIAWACATVAVAARLARAGGVAGLWAYGAYDDGVYFAAADAFVHGRVPYRDFLLLHPPGIVIVLSPFAELTRWMSDAHALVAARLAFIALGAVNTALVVLVARRSGRAAALTGGLLYALLPAATGVEYLTMLEPVGTTALLAAVLLARHAGRAGASGWWSFAAGAAVAVAPLTKIWGVVIVAVLLGWHAWRLGARAALRATCGALATALVVLGPFALLAGGALWHDVVLDQLRRPRTLVSAGTRIVWLSGASTAGLPRGAVTELAAAIALGLTCCAVIAWRARRDRFWVLLAAAQVSVLLLSPSFFDHYAAFAAPSLVLLVASATAAAPRWSRSAIAVAACAVVILATASTAPASTAPFPARAVDAALPRSGCVGTDAPATLALVDRLTLDLERRCTVPVDLTGFSYDQPVLTATGPVSRASNPLYQEQVVDDLTTGDAVVLVRGAGDGFSATTTRRILDGRQSLQLAGNVRVLTGTDARPDQDPR